MNVLVTGANGNVGTAILDRLEGSDEYRFTYLDIVDDPDRDTVVEDITDYDAIRPAFTDQDAVIHLMIPAELVPGSTEITWSGLLADYLEGTTNVVRAAVDAGVDSFVLASSNHVVGMYEIENAPDIHSPDSDLVVDHTVQPRPDSMYAVAKLFAEGLGRLAADAHGLRFYALRIGSVRSSEWDHPYGDAERQAQSGSYDRDSEAYDEAVARMKTTWQSRRDIAHMVDCCLRDDSVESDVFYGVSDNDGSWMDIEHAKDVIGYDPQDNADEWDSPPDR